MAILLGTVGWVGCGEPEGSEPCPGSGGTGSGGTGAAVGDSGAEAGAAGAGGADAGTPLGTPLAKEGLTIVFWSGEPVAQRFMYPAHSAVPRFLGLDLDGLDSGPGAPGTCRAPATATPDDREDLPGGGDNALGRALAYWTDGRPLESGESTGLIAIHLAGYPAPIVDVGLYAVGSREPGHDPLNPFGFWEPGLFDGDPARPRVAAYDVSIVEGVLEVDLQGTFRLPFVRTLSATGGPCWTDEVHHPRLRLELKDAPQWPEPTVEVSMILGGRVPLARAVSYWLQQRASYDVTGAPVCDGAPSVLARADLPLDGPQDPNVECDAISVGYFVDLHQVRLASTWWDALSAPPLANYPGEPDESPPLECLCP